VFNFNILTVYFNSIQLMNSFISITLVGHCDECESLFRNVDIINVAHFLKFIF